MWRANSSKASCRAYRICCSGSTFSTRSTGALDWAGLHCQDVSDTGSDNRRRAIAICAADCRMNSAHTRLPPTAGTGFSRAQETTASQSAPQQPGSLTARPSLDLARVSPAIIILAGPNGAGKTTAAPFLLRDALAVSEFVNADRSPRVYPGSILMRSPFRQDA